MFNQRQKLIVKINKQADKLQRHELKTIRCRKELQMSVYHHRFLLGGLAFILAYFSIRYWRQTVIKVLKETARFSLATAATQIKKMI